MSFQPLGYFIFLFVSSHKMICLPLIEFIVGNAIIRAQSLGC